MNLYTSGSTDSTERFSMFLLWTTMRHVQTCVSYVQPSLCNVCIMYKHVYTIIYTSISFIQCSDRVYTRIYWNLYLCLCAYMFRPCIYHVHTWHVQFHFAMNKKYKKYYCKVLGTNPRSCAKQPAALTTTLPACLQVIEHMYIALPDSEGWWRGAGPAAPPAPRAAMT